MTKIDGQVDKYLHVLGALGRTPQRGANPIKNQSQQG